MRVSPQLISPTLARRWSLDFASALHRTLPLEQAIDRSFREDIQVLLRVWGLTDQDLLHTSYTHLPMDQWRAAQEQQRRYDTAPLPQARVKAWAKAIQVELGGRVPLNLCQTALAQTLGCSAWAGLPGRLAQINAERAQVRADLGAEAETIRRRTTPWFAKGDWVIERPEENSMHPSLGKVRDTYYDNFTQEWLIDLVLYDADGRRLGRVSPRMGGPGGFEPAVPGSFYQRMQKPDFPMERDRTGYRDWRAAAQLLPNRDAPAKERQTALLTVALERLERKLRHRDARTRLPPPGKELDELIAKVQAKHANPTDPADFIPRGPLVQVWVEAQEASWYASKSPEEGEEAAAITTTVELHRHIDAVADQWTTSPPAAWATWSADQRRTALVEAGFAAYVAEVEGIMAPADVVRPEVDEGLLAQSLARCTSVAPRKAPSLRRPRNGRIP